MIFAAVAAARAQEDARLPDTGPLTAEGDLSASMLDGAHRLIDRKIAESIDRRGRHWKRDLASREAYERSIAANRERFARRIGVIDERLPVGMERFGDARQEAAGLLATTLTHHVYRVRWPVLDGVTGEGLLLEPRGAPIAQVVAVPDADQSPEQLAGLAEGSPSAPFAATLARGGCRVIVPVLLDRSSRFTGNLVSGRPDPGYSHREWIHRQAYHMGRHVIGYEVQKVLAAVDWFERAHTDKRASPIGVFGYGEGGLVAFYAAAVDPRIDAAAVSGYFRSRQGISGEPLYRNVWGLLDEFGDAEIASLIAPRGLIVEHSDVCDVVDRQTTTPPEVNGFALDGIHGRISTPPFDEVAAEFERIDQLVPPKLQRRRLIAGGGQTIGAGSEEALEVFTQLLGVTPLPTLKRDSPKLEGDATYVAPRQRRQVKELEDHVQALVDDSHQARDKFFQADAGSLETFTRDTRKLRDYAWRELFGKFDEPLQPINPRSRTIYDRPAWRGYEVVLDVLPDLFAWGVLLLPKDIAAGEKRPVVVCQHGRNGVPKDVIEGDQAAYHDFAARLAERGFIVFAPHNPYRGEDRYRRLSRKANAVKASLFSFILAQHEQILNWLVSLPQVDPERIAFYGLSYGGETAVRVPPLLERYCLSICSADFNDWTRKVASTRGPHSFMFTIEWEMPYFDMGRTFSYAELAWLMAPRP
ncbi:MAG TPA: dienelactone hydrolase family protein, partial [Pirellulales bacterium]|nr:dienelactone hydrolase family protein [Pirellulales bacterium]